MSGGWSAGARRIALMVGAATGGVLASPAADLLAQERTGAGGRPGLEGEVSTEVRAVAGLWGGPLHAHGQTSGFNLRIVPASFDSVDVLVSMPAIGVFDMPAGRAEARADGVHLGPWVALLDAEQGTLTGTVPPTMMPAHPADFTLRRTTALEPTGFEPMRAPALSPAWVAEVGAPVWAGLVAVGDGVIVADDDGGLRRLDGDGALVWELHVGGGVRGTPTVDGARTYVLDDAGRLSAVDTDRGRLLWSAAVDEPASRVPPNEPGSRYDHYGSSVRVADGAGYLGTYGGSVVAVDLDDGSIRWSVPEGSSVLGTPTVEGDRLFYGTFEGDVVALERVSGAELWRRSTGGAITSSLAVEDGLVVGGNRAYDVFALDADDGAVVWEYYYWWSWVESPPVIHDGVVYIGSSDAQRVHALDLTSGEHVWTGWVEGSAWAALALGDGDVFVGTVGVAEYITDHQARFFRIDRDSGRAVGRYDLERPGDAPHWGFASAPAVGSDYVYAATIGGRVLAFPRR